MRKRIILSVLLLLAFNLQGQNIYFVDDNPATNLETGADWESAFKTIRGALEKAMSDGSTNTIVFVKEGTYGNESPIDGPGMSSLPAGDVVIRGGFPDEAIGTDACSYNPGENIVDITSGKSLYSIDKDEGGGVIELAGLRFNNTDDVYSASIDFASIVTVVGTNTEFSFSQYYFEDLVITNQQESAFIFDYSSTTTSFDNFYFKNCFFQGNTVDTPIEFRSRVNKPSIEIDGCDFVGNSAAGSENGGAISIESNGATVKIAKSTFCNNDASGIAIGNSSGGAIYVGSSTNNSGINVTVDQCDFSANSGEQGAAVYFKNIAYGLIKNSHFDSQIGGVGTRIGLGGAVALTGNDSYSNVLELQNNIFNKNSGDAGGAVGVEKASLISSDNKFYENHATVSSSNGGGAIGIYGEDIQGSSVTSSITRDTFKGNYSAVIGGAISATYKSSFEVHDSEFCSNYTTGGTHSGGAICLRTVGATLDNNQFKSNIAEEGGAVAVINSHIHTDGNIFVRNHAGIGGAVHVTGYSDRAGVADFSFKNDNYSNNYIDFSKSGTVGGGAIFIENANNGGDENLEFINVEFVKNKALHSTLIGYGGAILLDKSNAKLTDCKFDSNTATQGGAVRATSSSFFVNGSSTTASYFRGNWAKNEGGAMEIIGNGGYEYPAGVTIDGKSDFRQVFLNTEFYNNSSSDTNDRSTNTEEDGGGALFLTAVLSTAIQGCSFIGNQTWIDPILITKGGGAISSSSILHVKGSEFSDNRTNNFDYYVAGVGASDILPRDESNGDFVFEDTNMQLEEYGDYPHSGNINWKFVGTIGYKTIAQAKSVAVTEESSQCGSLTGLKTIVCPSSPQQTLFKEEAVAQANCNPTFSEVVINFKDKSQGNNLAPDGPYNYTLTAPSGNTFLGENITGNTHSFLLGASPEIGKYNVAVIDKKGCEYNTTVDVSCQVLPVELSYFELIGDACEVNLIWKADSEENFSHYEIEWSTDAVNFQTIGVVKSSGNPDGDWYRMNAESVVKENYYRLKMVDLDETYAYSKIEYIQTDCENDGAIVYPNPVMDVANIRFFALSEDTEIILSDIFGNEMRRLKLAVEPATWNNLTLDMTDFNAGTYLLRIDGGGRSYSRVKKIIVTSY